MVTTPEFLAKVLAAATRPARVRAIVAGVSPRPRSAPRPSPGHRCCRSPSWRFGAAGSLIDTDPSGLAALLYTGGTTGRSKGVMISHDALSASSWAATATSYDEALAPRCCRCRSRTSTG